MGYRRKGRARRTWSSDANDGGLELGSNRMSGWISWKGHIQYCKAIERLGLNVAGGITDLVRDEDR